MVDPPSDPLDTLDTRYISPYCGDGACFDGETCTSCPGDCGACTRTCGDGICAGTESGYSCPVDCALVPPSCGDGFCNGTESCASCASDCLSCPPCNAASLEDCYNVLQVFENTDPANRPIPACTNVANWMVNDPLDPNGLSLGTYILESPDIPSLPASPLDIHDGLYYGSLTSFNLVEFEGGNTLCSFIASWNAPLKSQWVVEKPTLSPIDPTAVAPNTCDNGATASTIDYCEAEQAALLAAAAPNIPPQDTADIAPDNTVESVQKP